MRFEGLFKIFGIKLPGKLKHGAFDGAVRGIIEAEPPLSLALLPLLDAGCYTVRFWCWIYVPGKWLNKMRYADD